LGLIRVLQTFPSGGELPGAFCFLYENAPLARRKFMTSFAGVGNLIGIGLSAAECYLLEKYLPYEFFIEWGWRISFILGGFLGCAGFYLRYRLHETPLFQEIVHHHRMHRSSIATVVKANWGKLIQAMGFGASQTVAFHVISILFPVYLYRSMGFSFFEILVLLIVSLAGMALLLPLFGKLADRIGCKEIVFYASILMLLLICPMYVAIHSTSTMFVLGILTPFVLCIASITALWPFLVADLFSTSIRYTCIGLSFNISDGVFGGIATVLTLYLLEKTGDPGVFVWILLFGSLVSLVSFNRIKEPR
jgi:MHS family proline/betaine transporter-like MFS transporter